MDGFSLSLRWTLLGWQLNLPLPLPAHHCSQDTRTEVTFRITSDTATAANTDGQTSSREVTGSNLMFGQLHLELRLYWAHPPSFPLLPLKQLAAECWPASAQLYESHPYESYSPPQSPCSLRYDMNTKIQPAHKLHVWFDLFKTGIMVLKAVHP